MSRWRSAAPTAPPMPKSTMRACSARPRLLAGQEHVGRPQIAVQHAALVCVLEAGRHLAQDGDRALAIEGTLALDHPRERMPGHEIGDQIWQALVAGADLGHRHDVRVVEPASQLDLALEARPRDRIGGALAGQDAQRDRAPVRHRARAVDAAERTVADQLLYQEAAGEPGADQRVAAAGVEARAVDRAALRRGEKHAAAAQAGKSVARRETVSSAC